MTRAQRWWLGPDGRPLMSGAIIISRKAQEWAEHNGHAENLGAARALVAAYYAEQAYAKYTTTQLHNLKDKRERNLEKINAVLSSRH